MRATVTIDSKRLDELVYETSAKSKASAVNEAITEYLRRKKIDRIMAMKGKLDFPVGADAKRLGGLVLLLLAYFCAMPWAGFLLSSLAFATLLVRLLSASGWFRCIVYGVLITALTWLFFIYFLKVPMPSGVIYF